LQQKLSLGKCRYRDRSVVPGSLYSSYLDAFVAFYVRTEPYTVALRDIADPRGISLYSIKVEKKGWRFH